MQNTLETSLIIQKTDRKKSFSSVKYGQLYLMLVDKPDDTKGGHQDSVQLFTAVRNESFRAIASHASAVLGPSDGLEALGASAGASPAPGLGADADPLGASELDVEEVEALSAATANVATAAAATSTRARAMAKAWCLASACHCDQLWACAAVPGLAFLLRW